MKEPYDLEKVRDLIRHYGTQAALSRAIDLAQGTLSQYVSGLRAIKGDKEKLDRAFVDLQELKRSPEYTPLAKTRSGMRAKLLLRLDRIEEKLDRLLER